MQDKQEGTEVVPKPDGPTSETIATVALTPADIEEAAAVESEPTRAELAEAAYKALTDSALTSTFTRAQRKRVTAKRKSAHASRMANKGKKRQNRNRAGKLYR